jgi:hypothetical protein
MSQQLLGQRNHATAFPLDAVRAEVFKSFTDAEIANQEKI